MTDIFISYAKQDRERARHLASALQACGWSVWWDRNIQVGQSFDEVIEHALDTAKSVVVLWSKDSVSSEWVKNEAASAAERGVLVPVLIDDVKPPLEFRRKQTANLIGWEGDTSSPGFQALCDGIAATASVRPAPPPSGLKGRPQASSRWNWNGRRVIVSVAAIAAALAGAVYVVLHLHQLVMNVATEATLRVPQQPEPSQADSALLHTNPAYAGQAGLAAGVLDFKWPGTGDCWEIYRGEEKAASSCGSHAQALQAGDYTVKPYGSSRVFKPFNVVVKPNAVTIADAMAGTLNFKWPGTGDCWDIYRGEEKVASSCGSHAQSLQAGDYTVKPYGSSRVFKPFNVRVTRGQTVTVP